MQTGPTANGSTDDRDQFDTMADWKLYYWPGMKGRGEYVRLIFEEAGVAYEEPARNGGGF